MHTRSDVPLVVVILTALIALLLYRRWLNRSPGIADVHDGLHWGAMEHVPHDGRPGAFGRPPDVRIKNAYLRIQYWRIDLPGFPGVEAVICHTRMCNGPLMLACHDGVFMRWHGDDPRLRRFETDEHVHHLHAIFAVVRSHAPPDR